PNFSNPTGVLVPRAHREALLERVLRTGSWLVEDDPYHVLQLDGPAGPGLLDLDIAGRGGGPDDGPRGYLGTPPKSIAPGFRIGWAVAEPEMIRMLALTKQSSDLSSSMFAQAVALQLLEERFEEGHVPRIVELYRQRRDVMYEVVTRELGEWFTGD